MFNAIIVLDNLVIQWFKSILFIPDLKLIKINHANIIL